MTDDRKAGIALIAGSVGGILTMAVHPTGAASLTADQVAHLSLVSAAAHSIKELADYLQRNPSAIVRGRDFSQD